MSQSWVRCSQCSPRRVGFEPRSSSRSNTNPRPSSSTRRVVSELASEGYTVEIGNYPRGFQRLRSERAETHHDLTRHESMDSPCCRSGGCGQGRRVHLLPGRATLAPASGAERAAERRANNSRLAAAEALNGLARETAPASRASPSARARLIQHAPVEDKPRSPPVSPAPGLEQSGPRHEPRPIPAISLRRPESTGAERSGGRPRSRARHRSIRTYQQRRAREAKR